MDTMENENQTKTCTHIGQSSKSHGGEGLDELGYANISYAGLDSLSVFC